MSRSSLPPSGPAGKPNSFLRSLPSMQFAFGALLAVGAIVPAVAFTAQSAQQQLFDPAAAAQFRQGLPQRLQPLVVDLASRSFLPSRTVTPTYTNDKADLYVQFTHELTATERGRLIQSGVRFFEVLTPTTWLVRVKRSAFEALQGSALVRGFENVLPEDKLVAELFQGKIRTNAVNLDGSYQLRVRFYDDVRLGEALLALDTIGVLVPDRTFAVNKKIEVACQPQKLAMLAQSSSVQSIEPIPVTPITDNVDAAALSNIDEIQAPPYNLTGAGVIFGEWDEGNVRETHPDLTGRVTNVENTSNGDHSTHVAGTIIGNGTNNALARGMSTAATLFSWNFNGNPANEHVLGSTNLAIRITNNSWGPGLGWNDQGTDDGNNNLFGAYDGESGDFDQAVRITGLVICKSSGNDRDDCDPMDGTDCDGSLGADGQRYDTIPTWGISKNVVTVGATFDLGGISGFSSSGPADDGRIKPDIVANGTGLTSTWAGGTTIPSPSCDGLDYCSIGGTSMSTPTTAGAIGLLFERYRQVYLGLDPSPDIIKALLVNTAVDAGRPGPDYLFGHGILDALAAAQVIDAGPVRILTEAVGVGEIDSWLIAVPAGTPSLRATLNWIDPAGSTNSANADIVNNLNLELISPTNQIFHPFACDPANVTANATNTAANVRDTVENCIVANPAQGFWRARVIGASVPIGPQNYALVVNRALQLGTQPNITVNAALDYDEQCEGEFQDKIVSIFNTGGANLLVHHVNVTAGNATFVVQPNPIQPFLVQPGAHVDVTVRFDPTGPGPFTGNLEIFSNDPDQGLYNLSMTGSGCPPPNIAVSGSTDFGLVCTGVLAEKTIQICNTGGDDLNVASVSFGACDDFHLVNTIFPATVLPGHCLPLTVRYEPNEGGDHLCTMVIVSNDPDGSPLNLNWIGSTPDSSLDVQDVPAFDPTVLVTIGDCERREPLNITNNGTCPIYIKDVMITPPGAHYGDFVLLNRPAVPITLNPGEALGDGLLQVAFQPHQVERHIIGTLKVKYQSNLPAIGDDTEIVRTFCGEGVKTGGRLVVKRNGVAVPLVDRVTLWKVESLGPPMLLTNIESVTNKPLVSVQAVPPCPAFDFHREWGGITNPIQLAPGNYLVEVRVTVNGSQQIYKLNFTVDTCDFLPGLVINI